KDIADHAVFLPDGFRFSPGKTRRDWSNEGVERLRAFYAPYGPEGRLPVQSYLAATVRHRDLLATGKIADVAAKEKLNAKYLAAPAPAGRWSGSGRGWRHPASRRSCSATPPSSARRSRSITPPSSPTATSTSPPRSRRPTTRR